jgi:uncharacterized DUF497 family protein
LRHKNLIWSRSVIEKLQTKHNVVPEEVAEAYFNRQKHVKRGPDDIYYVYSQTRSGRYLLIVLADKGDAGYKVVTARDMDQAERRYYQRRR